MENTSTIPSGKEKNSNHYQSSGISYPVKPIALKGRYYGRKQNPKGVNPIKFKKNTVGKNKNQLKILELIRINNNITTLQMAEEVGISKRKIIENINKLKHRRCKNPGKSAQSVAKKNIS